MVVFPKKEQNHKFDVTQIVPYSFAKIKGWCIESDNIIVHYPLPAKKIPSSKSQGI